MFKKNKTNEKRAYMIKNQSSFWKKTKKQKKTLNLYLAVFGRSVILERKRMFQKILNSSFVNWGVLTKAQFPDSSLLLCYIVSMFN